MGRWKRGRNRGRGGRSDRRTLKRDFKEPREGGWRKRKEDWADLVKENEKFEEYYKSQGIVPDGEWDEFLEALRRPLPATFRINGRGRFAEALRKTIELKCKEAKEEGKDNVAPKCLPWYPDGLAWSVLASRKDLRRQLGLEDFHDFLKRETEDGSLSRQEAVSMIPPLFLDVLPDHKVLDQCASPGSKTFQILEMLHINPEVPPSGMVIANDVEYDRCNLLTHQIKRMCSPNIMVTSHDGSRYPNRKKTDNERVLEFDRILCDVPCSSDGTLRKSPDIWRIWRVGNGNALHILQLRLTLKACQLLKIGGRLVYSTCSLNPIEDEAVVAEVIRRTGGAMQLVDVSDQIPELKRMPGLKTWKVFDPNRSFEDYAEVERVRKEGRFKLTIDETFFPDAQSDAMPLERCMRVLPHHQDTGGFFVAVLELVKELPFFQYPSADHRWQDCDHPKKNRKPQKENDPKSEEENCEDQPEANEETSLPQASGSSIPPGLDPEKPQSDQDAGGNDEIEPDDQVDDQVEDEVKTEAQDEAAEPSCAPKPEDPSDIWSGEFPLVHKGIDRVILLDNHPLVKEVCDFYGMDPTRFGDHLVCRMLRNGCPRKVYFISDAVKEVLQNGGENFLRIQAVGQKILDRHEHKNSELRCIYRFSQEGLPLALEHITKRILYTSIADIITLLETGNLYFPMSALDDTNPEGESAQNTTGASAPESSENLQKRERPGTITNQDLLQQLENEDDGGAVAMLKDEDAKQLGLPLSGDAKGGLTANSPVALACWRTRYRINVMVSKPDRKMILDKLMDAKSRMQKDQEALEKTRQDAFEKMEVKESGAKKRKESEMDNVDSPGGADDSKKQKIDP